MGKTGGLEFPETVPLPRLVIPSLQPLPLLPLHLRMDELTPDLDRHATVWTWRTTSQHSMTVNQHINFDDINTMEEPIVLFIQGLSVGCSRPSTSTRTRIDPIRQKTSDESGCYTPDDRILGCRAELDY